MTIRSGKGDNGLTALLMEGDFSKDSAHVRALGDLDEFVGHLGLIKAKTRKRREKDLIEKIQTSVFVIASEIAVGKHKRKKLGRLLKKSDVHDLESTLYELEARIDKVNCFQFPGKNELSALYDIARAVARSAERSVVGLLKEDGEENRNILAYLNCVSDLLFVKAIEKAAGRKRKTRKKKTAVKRRKTSGTAAKHGKTSKAVKKRSR